MGPKLKFIATECVRPLINSLNTKTVVTEITCSILTVVPSLLLCKLEVCNDVMSGILYLLNLNVSVIVLILLINSREYIAQLV